MKEKSDQPIIAVQQQQLQQLDDQIRTRTQSMQARNNQVAQLNQQLSALNSQPQLEGTNNQIEALKTQIDQLSTSSEKDMDDLQSLMNKLNEGAETAKNFIEKVNDMTSKIAENMR